MDEISEQRKLMEIYDITQLAEKLIEKIQIARRNQMEMRKSQHIQRKVKKILTKKK